MVEQASTRGTGGIGKDILDMRVVHSSLNRVTTPILSACVELYRYVLLRHVAAGKILRDEVRGGLGKQQSFAVIMLI